MGDMLLGALALMLVIEGLLPFLSPASWRHKIPEIAPQGKGVNRVDLVDLYSSLRQTSLPALLRPAPLLVLRERFLFVFAF